MIQAMFDEEGLFRLLVFSFFVVGRLFGLGKEALPLLLLGLRAILVEELEELRGGILVEGVGELGDRRWDL